LEKTTRPRRTAVPAMAVLLVLALGISLFLSVAIQTARYSILRHDFRVEWYVFVLWAAAFAILCAAWRTEGRREAGRSGAGMDQAARRRTASWLPLAAFLISPFLLLFY